MLISSIEISYIAWRSSYVSVEAYGKCAKKVIKSNIDSHIRPIGVVKPSLEWINFYCHVEPVDAADYTN